MISTPFVAVPPRRYGGTELMVYHLVEGLVERGHDVTLFATATSRTSAELRCLYPEPQWPPGVMHELNHVTWSLQQIQPEEFDVVHAHSAVTLACARLLPELPLVYTIHHVREEELSSFYRWFQQPYYVAISADQARREAPLRNLEIIHHGLDPSDYGWTDTPEDYVCFLGRLAPVKGPHTAIDVAAAAGVPIRVAGEVHPVDAEFGAREIRPRLAQPHVTFLGSVGITEKAPLLRDARAFLSPLDWDEPFGLVFIESMLSGCPVVAYPRGSVPELVEAGVTGFIVRDPEEMADIIRDGGPAEQFDRQRCRERAVERFGRDRMVEDYERVYERATEDTAPFASSRIRIA